MIKLMKYEFRKSMFSKLIAAVITAVMEVLLLLGIFLKWNSGLGWGSIGLMLTAMFAIIYLGIESILTLHRDLNTKQSYMLFLTPHSSFQILGAKILENALTILIAGLVYAALAALDISLAVLYIGGLEEFLNMLRDVAKYIELNIDITSIQLLTGFLAALSSWLMMIVTADLAIVLCATVFAGKKFSSIVSFAIYLVLTWIAQNLLRRLPDPGDIMLQFLLLIGGSFVIAALMYLAAGWIMERKLSV